MDLCWGLHFFQLSSNIIITVSNPDEESTNLLVLWNPASPNSVVAKFALKHVTEYLLSTKIWQAKLSWICFCFFDNPPDTRQYRGRRGMLGLQLQVADHHLGDVKAGGTCGTSSTRVAKKINDWSFASMLLSSLPLFVDSSRPSLCNGADHVMLVGSYSISWQSRQPYKENVHHPSQSRQFLSWDCLCKWF